MKYYQLAKTYIWHNKDCYCINTINRTSSAPLSPNLWYAETLVWSLDKYERGKNILYQDTDNKDSIQTHQYLVEKIFKKGIRSLMCEEDN